MNKDQRNFLVDTIRGTYQTERKAIESQRKKKPSLNNYLVAAFLDGTIQFNSMDALKEKMRRRVLEMGHDQQLLHRDRNRWANDSEEDEDVVHLSADELFVLPESGLRHIDHILCNALFLAGNDQEHPELDDRYRPT